MFKGQRAVVVVYWITEVEGSGNLSDMPLNDKNCDKRGAASSVRDVAKALSRVGLSAPSAPSLSWDNSPLEMVLEQEVEGVDQKKLAELLARHGGKTSRETGA